MVTHSSTSRPVQCLCMAERTGCPVLTDLWSYVLDHHNRAKCNFGYGSILEVTGSRDVVLTVLRNDGKKKSWKGGD
jgi:hypothetical protein